MFPRVRDWHGWLHQAVERDGVWTWTTTTRTRSKAEMCGNGVRVFVNHLRHEASWTARRCHVGRGDAHGDINVCPEAEMRSAGVRYRVDMGPAASPAREPLKVSIPGIEGPWAIWVDMPSPHHGR